jgi:hypothetical protein
VDEDNVMNEYAKSGKADDMRSGGERQPRRGGTGEWTLWLIVAVIGVHVVEEHALNFTGWAARALHAPVTAEDFHLTNAGIILYCVACAVIGWRAPAIALSGAAIVLLNAIGFHGATSILVRAYSPGTATALLLFVPAGIAAYRAAARDGVLTHRAIVLSFGIALLWHAFLGTVFAIKYFSPLYP